MNNILIFLMGVFTALLIGAQFNAYIPLPACWGIWGLIILFGLFVIMVKNNPKQEEPKEQEENEE